MTLILLHPVPTLVWCVRRRERRVGMMRWRPSKGTWTASAETQRCTPLRHHRPRKQVGSPQSSDADGIPVISVSFYSNTFTLCECSEIFQQVPHHIYLTSHTLSVESLVVCFASYSFFSFFLEMLFMLHRVFAFCEAHSFASYCAFEQDIQFSDKNAERFHFKVL